MSKILLVYDDFAELNATELSLKKGTFDVIGLTNEYTVKDQIVSFNPDIVVGFGTSQRVSSLSVGKKIKEMNRWTGKSILIFPKGHAISAGDLIRMRMDMLLESPVSVIRLIQIICKLLNQDEKTVLDKLAKSFAKDRNDNLAFASFDSATVKAIQTIQGELEHLDSSTPFELNENASSGAENIDVTSLQNPVEPTPEIKKSFFELDEKPKVNTNTTDPFAALISELKGEAPQKAAEAKVKLAENTKSGREEDEQPSVVSTENDNIDFTKIGEKLREEVEAKQAGLNEKVKKYTELCTQLQLYPESTIKKVKAKKELKRLKETWNSADLEAQDQSRREFVERLFASKKDKS